MGGNRQTLKRIVALLLALAELADRASARSQPVLCLVLWILRPAEAIARRFVVETSLSAARPAPALGNAAPPHAGGRAEALGLAVAFRTLAAALEALIGADRLHGGLAQTCRRALRDVPAGIRNLGFHPRLDADTS